MELAGTCVIIDDSHRLHKSVTSCRPDEFPTSTLEFFAERRRFIRYGGNVSTTSNVRFFLGLELPKEIRQSVKLRQQLKGSTRVVDRRFDFPSVSNDAFVFQQTIDISFRELSDFCHFKFRERFAKRIPLSQYRYPTKSGLKSFQADLFEQSAIFLNRKPPFFVVIANVFRIVSAPPTAFDSVFAFFDNFRHRTQRLRVQFRLSTTNIINFKRNH